MNRQTQKVLRDYAALKEGRRLTRGEFRRFRASFNRLPEPKRAALIQEAKRILREKSGRPSDNPKLEKSR